MERVITGAVALMAVPLRKQQAVEIVLPETGDYDGTIHLSVRDNYLYVTGTAIQKVPDRVQE